MCMNTASIGALHVYLIGISGWFIFTSLVNLLTPCDEAIELWNIDTPEGWEHCDGLSDMFGKGSWIGNFWWSVQTMVIQHQRQMPSYSLMLVLTITSSARESLGRSQNRRQVKVAQLSCATFTCLRFWLLPNDSLHERCVLPQSSREL